MALFTGYFKDKCVNMFTILICEKRGLICIPKNS